MKCIFHVKNASWALHFLPPYSSFHFVNDISFNLVSFCLFSIHIYGQQFNIRKSDSLRNGPFPEQCKLNSLQQCVYSVKCRKKWILIHELFNISICVRNTSCQLPTFRRIQCNVKFHQMHKYCFSFTNNSFPRFSCIHLSSFRL